MAGTRWRGADDGEDTWRRPSAEDSAPALLIWALGAVREVADPPPPVAAPHRLLTLIQVGPDQQFRWAQRQRAPESFLVERASLEEYRARRGLGRAVLFPLWRRCDSRSHRRFPTSGASKCGRAGYNGGVCDGSGLFPGIPLCQLSGLVWIDAVIPSGSYPECREFESPLRY